MKLYYAQGTCSLAPHIALREAALPFTLVRFDIKSQALEGATRIADVNPKGYVPVLELEDGRRLTEVSAVLQYVADLAPATKLAPPAGSFERYRLQEWLNYLAAEIHKSFWPFFHDGCDAEKPNQGERLKARFAWIEKQLAGSGGPFLMGKDFTVADAYLFTMANWLKPAGFDIAIWPTLAEYRKSIRDRVAVRAAIDAERP